MIENTQDFSLKANEIETIDNYLKNSKTSVLTILFTDIQGFTQYSDENGDHKTSEMRKVHDQIMQEEIEKNKNGKIIKYIGDAVMAIFSEPSAAVLIAVKIQRKLLHLYEAGEFPLKVRMGLHLGQVTIENKIGPDIFGGHVNKASRVESMANGGQIYATYSVIDSIKGQLETDNISFHNHGEVSAKGLKDKFDLFEILFMRSQKAISPIGFKEKYLTKKHLSIMSSLFVFIAIASYFIIYPTLYMYNPPQVPVYLDHSKELNFKNLDEKYKEIHENILIGKHFFHYQISSQVRYYAPIEVKSFNNFLKPQFKYFDLPSKETYVYLYDKKSASEKTEDKFDFEAVSGDYNISKHSVEFKTFIQLEKENKEDGLKVNIEYEFIDQLGEVKKGSFNKLYPPSNSSQYEWIELGSFHDIKYSISLSVSSDYIKAINRLDYRSLK